MEWIAPGIWRVRLGEPERGTPVGFRGEEMREEALARLTPAGAPPFADEDIAFRTSARGCVIELPLRENEDLYGFGLQLKSFNQKGKKKHLRNNADPVADTGDTHAPVPFYVSALGYGVLVDTARYASFYCGSGVKIGAGETGGAGRAVADETGELYGNRPSGTAMTVEIPHARGADLYLFAGPDMKTAVRRYVLFSGGGCLPPLYGLGVLYRAYAKNDAVQVLELARSLREEGIPCDTIGLEPGWQSHAYSCSFQWDGGRFPHPDALIGELRKLNYHVNLWEHAFVHPSSPLYEPLLPYAGDYAVWGGLVPDLALEEAAGLFAGYHRQVLADRGIDGFKLDECDGSDYTNGWSFPNCSEFPSGLDGEQMHSLLGILYQRCVRSIFERAGRRTFGQARSSHALAAPLPFALYSDLYDHRDFIRGMVNMGFSGLLWTPEVRGSASAEELARRIQTVIFSPQACLNIWNMPHPPWMQYDPAKNREGEMLDDREEIKTLCRNLLSLRMRFIPYLYAAFARYFFEGVPPFRALVMDDPADPQVRDIDDEYMAGDDVLVAPVTAGGGRRKVYLPKGNWYCFWTDRKYPGTAWHELEAPLERIPLFVREGALLPLARPVECVAPDTCFDVTVKCYGDGCRDFVLYEDDGISCRYRDGEYNTIRLARLPDGCLDIVRTNRCRVRRYRIVEWTSVR